MGLSNKSSFVIAGWFWGRFLRLTGIAAITMPWGRVYMREEYYDHPELRGHESVHLAQIKRDGAIRFSIKYLYWLTKYGYRKNPYEVEAYEKFPLE
jgi:hypothetical protein